MLFRLPLLMTILIFGLTACDDDGKSEAQKSALIEKWSISTEEAPMLDLCTKTMANSNVKFVSRVAEDGGCGCMIRTIADKTTSSDFVPASTILMALLKGSAVGEARASEIMLQAQTSQQISDSRTQTFIKISLDAAKKCSSQAEYISSDEFAAIERAENEKFEKTKSAIEEVVRSGGLSREKADAAIEKAKERREEMIARNRK